MSVPEVVFMNFINILNSYVHFLAFIFLEKEVQNPHFLDEKSRFFRQKVEILNKF